MRRAYQRPSRKRESGSRSARRLGLWAVALAALIFALVPLAFNPSAIMVCMPVALLVEFRLSGAHPKHLS